MSDFTIVNLPYKLKEITKNVFLVTFKHAYDVSMVFCRVQEFYESPVFKGKHFLMDDYQRYYALHLTNKERKGVFSYPDDWRGFNVPSHIIKEVYSKLLKTQYDRLTSYDVVFLNILKKIVRKTKGNTFYLIGTSTQKGTKDVVKHEVAHGLYTTNPTYKAEVDKLLASAPKAVMDKMFKALKFLNYHPSVWKDEMNAYMSTGLHAEMDNKSVRKARVPFVKLLKRFR